MLKKREQVAEFTGDAVALQHAKVALHVCALGVISAAFQIAAARLALILQAMPKLEAFNFMFHMFSLWLLMLIGMFYFLIGPYESEFSILCSH